MSFGGVVVDNLGITDPIPSASLLTGLFGNALGYRRCQPERLQKLQDRLEYAVRVDRRGHLLTDYQTASLAKADVGWTTRGRPEGRAGGEGAYAGQHQRYRHFYCDAALTVAVHLSGGDKAPTLEQLAGALEQPARPLFIGRKPCLPGAPLVLGRSSAGTLQAALLETGLADDADPDPVIYQLSRDPAGPRDLLLHGLRNWRTDVHQGRQSWIAQAIGEKP